MELIIIVVVGLIAFGIFKNNPKFKCPECNQVNNKSDVKIARGQVSYRHTRKDGGRDRRFNQFGSTSYKLSIKCKSCKNVFRTKHNGKVAHFEKMTDDRLKKDFKELDKIAERAIEKLKKGKSIV